MTGWLILDIEASGLGDAAFPIEIGWASLAEDGSAGSLLIRPEPDWPLAGWDDIVADVHGITLQDLIDTGHPAREVCRAFRNAAAGMLLLSDAHIQDQVWLDRLFEAEWPPLAPILVSDIRSVVPPLRRSAFDDALHALPRPHRAGPDAKALARILNEHCRPRGLSDVRWRRWANVAELSRARVAVADTRRARAGVDSLTSYHRSDGVSP